MSLNKSIKMNRARILGTGHYVPEKILTNHDLEKIVDTSDEWIVERTGMKERRIATKDEASSDMAAKAALRAMEMAQIKPEEIDMVVVGTISPDMPLPACAVFVQEKIGARNCAAFDLAAACAGFIYALSIGEKFIRFKEAKYVVVVGVELLSRLLDWSDRNTCVLFGDGAGAVVLGPNEDSKRGILSTHLYADGSLWDILNIPGGGSKYPASLETIEKKMHYVKMQGREVYKVAVRNIAEASKEALRYNHLKPEDITWVIAHQANLRILDGVSKRVGIPLERFYLNIEKYGNTSSASIPIALDEAQRQGILKPGDLLLLAALGAGVSWGSAIVQW
jgi:3-oxoacyl-[acyl-carrier-protein] synthase-3